MILNDFWALMVTQLIAAAQFFPTGMGSPKGGLHGELFWKKAYIK